MERFGDDAKRAIQAKMRNEQDTFISLDTEAVIGTKKEKDFGGRSVGL